MLKDIFIYKLFLIIFINIIPLNAYEKAINVERYSSQWGNLFVEGYDIDLKAAELAQQKLNGGYYAPKLHVVIPVDAALTEKEWKNAKDRIARAIGPIPNLSNQQTVQFWKNSAKDVDELFQDASAQAPSYKNDFQYIAALTGTTIYFGPDDRNIVKERDSLADKVKRDANSLGISEQEALAKISDALRGTLIVDDFFQISSVIAEIIRYVDYKDGQVVFKNLWAEERKQDGYVGIHAKILLPMATENSAEEPHNIIAEMQIHFRSIVDGTEGSAKEREHTIYESIRHENYDPSTLSAASRLLYLTAMQEVLQAFEQKPSKGS